MYKTHINILNLKVINKASRNTSNVTRHKKIFIETKICLIPLPVMCESLVSEDEFETLKKNVEVQHEIHYEFNLFLEVRSCNCQNISRNSTAPIRHRNHPDKN